MTYKEIIAELERKIPDFIDFGRADYEEEELGLGEIVEVHKTGGEDKGSNWTSVRHFVDHDVYIKVSGYYSSYVGVDFGDETYEECCEEVRPTKKTITVYE